MRQYRGLTKEGKIWVYGDVVHNFNFEPQGNLRECSIVFDNDYAEVIPETVGQQTGLCYEGDYVVMDCWNGGDGIDEPSHHDIFEGIVIYDKKICRFGLQTKLCDEGQIEVGLEDSRFTEIEILGNKWENPELLEQE